MGNRITKDIDRLTRMGAVLTGFEHKFKSGTSAPVGKAHWGYCGMGILPMQHGRDARATFRRSSVFHTDQQNTLISPFLKKSSGSFVLLIVTYHGYLDQMMSFR